jgi:hypothetical protein
MDVFYVFEKIYSIFKAFITDFFSLPYTTVNWEDSLFKMLFKCQLLHTYQGYLLEKPLNDVILPQNYIQVLT